MLFYVLEFAQHYLNCQIENPVLQRFYLTQVWRTHYSALPHSSPYQDKHHPFTCSSLPPHPVFHIPHFTPRGFVISTCQFGLPPALLQWTLFLSGARTLWRLGFGLASLTEVCALCVCREGRSLSDGLPPKLSSTGSSPLPVMCGATGSSCGKSCLTERGLTGTWLIKMYVFNWYIVIIIIAFYFL